MGHWQNSGFRRLNSVGNGHCWVLAPMQLSAIEAGYSDCLVEYAFSHGPRGAINRLAAAGRYLTIRALHASIDPDDHVGLGGQQTTFSKEEIRRLALDYTRGLYNLTDWENCIGYIHDDGGGHGDDRAVRLFGRSVGISDIEVVREDVTQGKTLLVEVGGGTTALRGKHMVLWKPGHFSALARNRNVSSRYKRYIFVSYHSSSYCHFFSDDSSRDARMQCFYISLLSCLDRWARKIGTSAKCTRC